MKNIEWILSLKSKAGRSTLSSALLVTKKGKNEYDMFLDMFLKHKKKLVFSQKVQ